MNVEEEKELNRKQIDKNLSKDKEESLSILANNIYSPKKVKENKHLMNLDALILNKRERKPVNLLGTFSLKTKNINHQTENKPALLPIQQKNKYFKKNHDTQHHLKKRTGSKLLASKNLEDSNNFPSSKSHLEKNLKDAIEEDMTKSSETLPSQNNQNSAHTNERILRDRSHLKFTRSIIMESEEHETKRKKKKLLKPTNKRAHRLNHIFKRENNHSKTLDYSTLFKNVYNDFYASIKNIKTQEKPPIDDAQKDGTDKSDPGTSVVKSKIDEFFSSHKTFINCDLKYFNFDYLIEQLGYFDVVLMDPPWRIKGGQQFDSQFMFTNNKFKLEYDTMSNLDIFNLRVDKLVKTGFIFLWILANQINVAAEMMNQWGFELIDIIVWVKMKDGKISLSHGYYFMHSYELCLVGYKAAAGETLDYHSKVSNNIIFAETRKKSQKPDELYEIIELMLPGAKKIELFARNNNLRSGWFSLGNQLGDQFDSWKNYLLCNICNKQVEIGQKRYKSRKIHDLDLCESCFEKNNFLVEDFFVMNNDIEEEILHHYHKCNHCGVEPIWGVRFTCNQCEDLDFCEGCFDKNLKLPEGEKFHHFSLHTFTHLELPQLANGLPAHTNFRCKGCFQKPIIGACFVCSKCPNFAVCQNCFFNKPPSQFEGVRGHKLEHSLEMLFEPLNDSNKSFNKCMGCNKTKIEGTLYKCENCFNFYFCEKCYFNKEEFMKRNLAHSHKNYHSFMKINSAV